MQMGCAAVLINTAIAVSENPVNMAQAFSLAVAAGRLAYLSGIPPTIDAAQSSSPLTGFLRNNNEK
jgi:thiazole synthase